MCKRMLWKWASLSIGGPVGGSGGEVHLPGTFRESKRVLNKWRVSDYGSSVRGTWR